MATMRDIVIEAMRSVPDLLAAEEVPAQADLDFALGRLNRMMHSWKASKVDTNHTTLTANKDFPLEVYHERGVIALLAVNIANAFSIAIPANLQEEADAGWGLLVGDYWTPAPMEVDRAMRHLPSQRRHDTV